MNAESIVINFSERERSDFNGMSKCFMGIGLALFIIGVLAVITPHIATLALEILVGALLIISGVAYLAHAFQLRKWRNITWELVLAFLFMLSGLLFLGYPFSGALLLTIILGFFFLIHGGMKIPMAFTWRPRPGWEWVLISGVLSILLGLIIIVALPGAAVWLIGLILGIDLIFTGVTLIALGWKLKGLTG